MAYPGGKNGSGVYQKIINLMPPHRVYIEAFLGGGAILRMKKSAHVNIGIDSDAAVTRMWLDMWRREKIPALQVIQADALEWLASYAFSGDELVYCDPPYLMFTRSCQKPIYRCEMTDQQHIDLLALLNRLPCMVMVSGYYSDLYASALGGWRSVMYQARTRGGRMATEWLWMNYPPPVELHDYRYLGENFRERERIQRKRNRWKNRLLRMPDLERFAVLSAVDEIRSHPGEHAISGDGIRIPSLETEMIEHLQEQR